jgi:transposase InsO family protein
LRHYWWPKMGASVEKYVLEYDKCQRYKPAQHPNATLQPYKTPTALWEHVGVDLITQLSGSNRFDSICVYIDHYSDQCHLVPCKSNLTAEGAADIHYSDVFRLHGIPKKIFSDCGPQFAARFMRALYKRLGIKTGFTTAYHPQGNGKVECKNQEVKQYLRLFCNKRQDDWASHLPATEFALNSRLHSGASQTPFEIVYSYRPDFTVSIGRRSNMPSLDECLDHLVDVRKEAEAVL